MFSKPKMPILQTLYITEKPEYKQEMQAVSVGKKQKLDGLFFVFIVFSENVQYI